MRQQDHIYFHSPCFDGIASAVLIWDVLQASGGHPKPYLHPVGYDIRDNWLTYELVRPSAVVDFLYHPGADFWADHHLTSFLNDQVRNEYQKRKGPSFIYDDRAPSCTGLLWKHFVTTSGYRNQKYEELVGWANKIDSANYDSVNEAILGDHPALIINRTLALTDSNAFSPFLVESLHERPMEEVIKLPAVQDRSSRAQSLVKLGLERFQYGVKREPDGIVLFDVDGTDAIVPRYAPFHFCRDARYSLGIVRLKDQAKIIAMRNPWRNFNSVPLGKIFEKVGGGGHRRIGAVVLRGSRMAEATSVRDSILRIIRQSERHVSIPVRP